MFLEVVAEAAEYKYYLLVCSVIPELRPFDSPYTNNIF